jgi:YtoQ family protein
MIHWKKWILEGEIMRLTVYLAGEIHSSWREEIKKKTMALNLPVDFVGPMENHDRSDNIVEEILGEQPNAVFKDEAASSFNNLRTGVLMHKADLVIALFGEQYKQWNTAMDASAAIASGKPVIIIRPEKLHHPLKELTQKANATVETVDQAIKALSYIYE